MNKKSIADVDVAGKRCLVRVDFNVPMKDGAITDDTRIRGAIPTVSYLLDKGAKVVLCSHMGKPRNILDDEIIWDKKTEKALSALPESERPAAAKAAEEKARKDDLKKFGLAPVAARLGELLGKRVEFASDVVGPDAAAKVAACREGECVLLQNLRFHAAEAGRGEDFCRKLAGYCDIYVNDAFGTAHRSHASTAAIAEYGFVKTAVCGFLIEKELRVMGGALENPERPFVAVLGGAKIADKLNVIRNLLDKCDALIVGGGMAYTFCLADGGYEGHSLVDTDKLDYCREMMEKAKALGKKIYLPADSVAVDSFPDPVDAPVDTVVCDSRAIPEGKMGLDIGPRARKQFAEVIASAKTVIWNGPMGVFENPVLSAGTLAVAEAMAGLKDATTIIGGGDSAAAVTRLGLADRMTHISTGGGASLEFFEGKTLPGIACLNDR